MLIRVVLLFLIFIVVVAMVQKALRPGSTRLRRDPGKAALDRLRCPTCRRVNLGLSPAPCERPDCRYRS